MPRHDHEGRSAVVEQAERLMRRWAVSLDLRGRRDREPGAKPWSATTHPYIAVSRETGAGGAELARMVASKLRWECLDRELLDVMAERCHLPHAALEVVDEQERSLLDEFFGYWLNKTVVAQTDYATHLGHVVLLAARTASAVFVGRGAQFYLPRERGLTVRLIAPPSMRIERIMRLRGLDPEQAKQYIAETDAGRCQFVARHFQQDVADPAVHDLVLNMQHIDLDAGAELVVEACRRRFPGA
jgi:cytidylate kinase